MLIVDDYVPLGEMLALLFEARGPFIARFIDDFDQAVDEARRFKPDICVLDLWEDSTEEMRGQEVAAVFLDDPVLCRIPIVYYTGSKATKQGNIVKRADFHGGMRISLPQTRPNQGPSEIIKKGMTQPLDLMNELVRILEG